MTPDLQSPIDMNLKALFETAQSNGALEYIYTLLRVQGIKSEEDPILVLEQLLMECKPENPDSVAIKENLKALLSISDPRLVLFNLVGCTAGVRYNSVPFILEKHKRSSLAIVHELRMLAEKADKVGLSDFAEGITSVFDPDSLEKYLENNDAWTVEQIKEYHAKVWSFLTYFLAEFNSARKHSVGKALLYKLAGFAVLELLVNDTVGLTGFKIHFSNGTTARFYRGDKHTFCENICPGPELSFNHGLTDTLVDEWKVNGKRLCEVGLPGRYNQLGEWKVILHPGNTEQLQAEIKNLSDDSNIQGVLFYMFCTGHRVIEFVVRTSLDTPEETILFENGIRLWKCPLLSDKGYVGQNTRVYDGWIEITEPTVECIKEALSVISVSLNRMAFTFRCSIDWRIKYSMEVRNVGSYATLEKSDIDHLDRLLRAFPTSEDMVILDAAIDWFNRARTSTNIFNRFLGYYIAVESVAAAISDGNANFELGYVKETQTEKRKARNECISQLHDVLYRENPVEFVTKGYFECVVGLKKKTRKIAELVFGENHQYIKDLFEKDEENSCLSEVRSELAHGGIALLTPEHETRVLKRLGQMEAIAHDFLTRIVLRLKPDEPIPHWSGMMRGSFSFSDPRTTLVASDEKMLSSKDWRIRPEWCE